MTVDSRRRQVFEAAIEAVFLWLRDSTGLSLKQVIDKRAEIRYTVEGADIEEELAPVRGDVGKGRGW